MRRNGVFRRLITSVALTATIGGLAVATATPAGASTPTVANGGFENPVVRPAAVFRTFNAGDSVGAWDVVSGSVDVMDKSFWASAEGDQSLELNGNEPGKIAQNLNTLPLTRYVVSFSLAADPYLQGVATGNVLANGKVIKNFSFDSTGKTYLDMGYVTVKTSFLATGLRTNLAFAGLTPPGGVGAVIDNVQVTPCLLVLCLS